MSVSITSPHNLRDTKLRDYLAEMRDRDRHVCRTCARFTGLDGCDRDTLRRLHLRCDDIRAVMSGAGICASVPDEEDRAPSLVLAEDDTCGEWEPCA